MRVDLNLSIVHIIEVRRIDDSLTIRGDDLFVDDCSVPELAREHGTPLFVLSEHKLRTNYRRWRDGFAAYWPAPVDIFPAFKANTTLASRHILTDEGAGADVYSESELVGVLSTGIDPARVSVNGGGKSDALLERCVAEGVRITVEDLDEPKRIDAIARAQGRRASIRLRVKPDFPSLWRPTGFTEQLATIDMGIQAYKSGIPQQYLKELGRAVLAMPNVDLVGLHLHVGRHDPSLRFWRGVMRAYADLVATLCHAWDWRPRELDVGGGFASPRDPFDKRGVRRDVLSSLVTYPLELMLRAVGHRRRYRAMSGMIEHVLARNPDAPPVPSIEAYAEAVATTLAQRLRSRGIDPEGIRLQAEPGRSMYCDAGIHVARVKAVKRQTVPVSLRWVLTDTTSFFMSGAVFEQYLNRFVIANRACEDPTEVADIVGHSCAADRILPFVKVPALEEGDLVALLDTGAYQEVSAGNFNALPRPATVLVRGDRAEVIRRAETIDDVYARDHVPLSLQRQAVEAAE